MSAQVAADLRAAADVLRRDGWTPSWYTDRERGCHCLMGAVLTVHGDPFGDEYHGYDDDPVQMVREFLWDYFGTPAVCWNDEPGRTADEVIAALEAAAVAAEADQ